MPDNSSTGGLVTTGLVGNSGIVTYPTTTIPAAGYITVSDPTWYVTNGPTTGTDPTYIPPKNENEIEIQEIKKGMFIAASLKNAFTSYHPQIGEPLEVVNINNPFVLAKRFDDKIITLDKKNYTFIRLSDEYVKILRDEYEKDEKKQNKPKMERALEL